MTSRRIKFDIRQAGKGIFIVLLAWLVLNTGFYLMATRPKVRAYRSLMEGSEPQLQALERRKKEVEARESYLEALKQAEQYLKQLRQEVLSTRRERMVDVQRELENLCGQFNIDFNSVTYDSELLPGQELDKMIMVVPLQGNYASLRKFLQAVEDSDKFLLVERVALAEGKEGGVMLQLSITLATYFNAPLRTEQAATVQRRPGDGEA
jgi:Tfp pilus assembly protein PilO